jgi:hypothetical protein
MAQTVGFGDLVDPSQQNQNQQNGQQNGQQQSSSQNQAPGAGQQGNAQAGATGAGQGPTSGGGAANGSGSQSLGQYKPQNYSQQNQGTGFVNLQSYLNANNPSQLQGAVANNINSQNQQTQGNLLGQQSTFQQGLQANQANTMANQGLVQNVLANPTGYSTATGANTAGVGQSGVNAPTATAGGAAPNLTQGTQFSNLINGQYQGPTGLANASQLQGQGAAAAQTAVNMGSAGGRTSILQQLMANPNYSQGMAGLDTALLGQGNQTALNTAANQSRQLNNQINQAVTGAQAQGAEAQSNAQQFAAQTQGQLGTQLQQTQAGLTNQAAQAQNSNNSQFAQLQSALASGTMSAQDASMMGLTQGENLYGVNAANYVTQNPMTATAQNVATPQQYAQMQALKQLAGAGANTQAQQVFQNFANPAAAGTYTNSPIGSANAQNLQSAIAGQQQNFDSQLAALNASIGQGTNIGAIGGQDNGILGDTAGGAAAGAAAGSFLGGTGEAIGGVLGGIAGAFGAGNQAAAESQARDAAKQAETLQLENYMTSVNQLASQFGMNTGQYMNQATGPAGTAAGQLFDPNNVGAGNNFQNIVNSIQGSLQANNAVNIVPNQQPGGGAIGPQLNGMLQNS